MIYFENFLEHIFQNISNSDTETGIIVASLSKSNPDYYYHWTRDSALTILLFVRLLNNYKKYYNIFRAYIQSYMDNEISITKRLNINELGEPKFYVNRMKFTEPWGRPQNDGPAIRSYVLAEYALHLLDCNETCILKPLLNTNRNGLIDRDLEYLLNIAVNTTSFDIWEEINGYHYFTILFQIKSLEQIEKLILRVNHLDSRICDINIAKTKLYSLFNKFYNHNTKTIKSSYNIINHSENHREWLDSSIFLASIYCKENPLCIYRLNTWTNFVKYNITKYGFIENILPIGRYYEDKYYDGYPWFITTIALAHYLKKCYNHMLGENINNDFIANLKILLNLLNIYDGDIYRSIRIYCKNIDHFIHKFYQKNGQLSEQFTLELNPISASHLTWSYTSFLLYKNTGFKK